MVAFVLRLSIHLISVISFRLETVILSDNNLSSISFDETSPTETTTLFTNLRSLTLNHNSISEVRYV